MNFKNGMSVFVAFVYCIFTALEIGVEQEAYIVDWTFILIPTPILYLATYGFISMMDDIFD
jgi:hypothetical protein